MAQRVKSNVMKQLSVTVREFENIFRITFKTKSIDYVLNLSKLDIKCFYSKANTKICNIHENNAENEESIRSTKMQTSQERNIIF